MEEDLEDIEIEIDDDVFLKLAKLAHERDITVNALVQELVALEVERIKDIIEEEEQKGNGC